MLMQPRVVGPARGLRHPSSDQPPENAPNRPDRRQHRTCRGCAKTWVLAVLALGVGSCYEDSSGGVIVVVGEPVGDAS